MTRRRSAMLGVFLLGLGGMTGACAPDEPGPQQRPLAVRPPEPPPVRQPERPGGDSPAPAPECSADVEEPCMRYRIPLVGNPNTDLALRGQYIAAFGTACYLSEVDSFDCYYKPIKKACEDAVKIGAVSGNAPYDPGYQCQPVGNGDYTLQIGSDVANKLFIYLEAAPRQTPLIDVNGTPTAVNGPYRNLTEPQDLAPGNDFYKKTLDKNGKLVVQKDLILQINRDAHGAIHSDLAGFVYPCDKNDPSKMCMEPLVLKEGDPYDPEAPEVHHVVRKKDKRCCPWGTNSNRNGVVISRKLNQFFTNDNPLADEVMAVNKVPPYTP